MGVTMSSNHCAWHSKFDQYGDDSLKEYETEFVHILYYDIRTYRKIGLVHEKKSADPHNSTSHPIVSHPRGFPTITLPRLCLNPH